MNRSENVKIADLILLIDQYIDNYIYGCIGMQKTQATVDVLDCRACH